MDPDRDPDRHRLSAGYLSASVRRFRVPDDPQVREIRVRTDGAEGGGRLWALVNDLRHDWSAGGSAAWCADGMTGFRWPGELPVALTGASRGSAGRVTVEFVTSAANCRCPIAPPRFDSEGRTVYFEFRSRFNGVGEDLSGWLRALARARGRLSTRARLQRGSRLLECAAGRARDLVAPDSVLAGWRNSWSSRIRAAAAHYRRGDLAGFQGRLTSAGRYAVRIVTRTTARDLAERS